MSQTTSEPKVPVETKAAIWGAPVVSVIAYLVFLLALAVAYLVKNDNLLITLCGVAAANGTTVVNFWLGSSRGSQDKDVTIASQSTQLANSTPILPKG
jgi:hypothetical protein